MNEELKKAYEGIEDDLELVKYEGFYNHIKEWNFIKNYITNLQQENARLKDKIERSFKIVDDKLTNLNLEYGVNNEFREEYDELWELLKEN